MGSHNTCGYCGKEQPDCSCGSRTKYRITITLERETPAQRDAIGQVVADNLCDAMYDSDENDYLGEVTDIKVEELA